MTGSVFWKKRGFTAVILMLGLMAAMGDASPAFAHKVTVFAWAEGDTVYTESKFSGGKKAKGATVEVYDPDGRRCVTGKTDGQGKFSFKIPGPTTLKVVLMAGAGHKSTWTLPAAEIQAALAASANALPAPEKDAPPPVIPPDETVSAVKPETDAPATAGGGMTDIRSVVEAALDKKLMPITAKLDRLQDLQEKAGAVDILGGIGYILGLVGIAAYVNARKKSG